MVAIDGKSLRRSFDRAAGASPLLLVSAWAVEERLVLGQMKVDAEGNEITAMPALLDLLDLAGATVTVDAMHCQRSTAETIVDRGGAYLMALKSNQPALYEDVKLLMDDPAAPADDAAETVDGDHGRIETRRAEILGDIGWLAEAHDWPGLAAVGKVTATRESDGRRGHRRALYLASAPLSAAALNRLARGHWGIENSLHWVLDVVFHDDLARLRSGHGPENMAVVKHMAMNLVRKPKDRHSLKVRRKLANLNHDYLESLLRQNSALT